jgi:hypothetical protein
MSNKHSLKVSIAGGLGNQLFRFMAAIYISSLTKKSIHLDLSWYDRKQYLGSSRQYELEYFPAIRNLDFFKTKSNIMTRYSNSVLERFPRISKGVFGYCNNLSTFHDLEKIEILNCDSQDIDFLPRDEIIQDYLSFPRETTDWFKNHKKLIDKGEPISVHVRMTDYLKYPEIYNVLSRDYYVDAISLLRKKIGTDRPIWLFSDDPKAALDWLGNFVKFTRVITPDTKIRPAEIMRLLSMSSGIILANSSFSWWSAYLGYLNKNTIEIVIPRRFLAIENPSINLLVQGWTVLDN